MLLLDEPLSNLDANLRVQMRREILDLQRALKLTTIFVTHDQEEANTISDRIAVLDDGVLQQMGVPMELYDEPVNRFVAHFLGTANLMDGRIEAAAEGARFVAAGGIALPLSGEAHAASENRTAMFRPQDVAIAATGETLPESSSPAGCSTVSSSATCCATASLSARTCCWSTTPITRAAALSPWAMRWPWASAASRCASWSVEAGGPPRHSRYAPESKELKLDIVAELGYMNSGRSG